MAIKQEQEILDLAAETFRGNVSIHAEFETDKHDRRARLVRMVIGKNVLRFNAEVKAAITKAGAALLMAQRKDHRHPTLLVTRYVNPQMADLLRTGGLEFIDTAGNAYLNQPPVYLFIKGNKSPETIKPMPYVRTFKASGLKLVYAFLCNPSLENKPYRQIADTAGLALGTVGWLMRELKYQGYLLDTGKQEQVMKIIQKGDLLRRWVDAYPDRLRPKLIMGRYRGEPGWWLKRVLDPDIALWGGEIAAEKLTNYLKPQIVTLYTTPQALNKLLIDNRLRKDTAGDVEILERFWVPGEAFQRKDMVHPILVYADLMAAGSQRDLEAAKIIYDRYIAQQDKGSSRDWL